VRMAGTTNPVRYDYVAPTRIQVRGNSDLGKISITMGKEPKGMIS